MRLEGKIAFVTGAGSGMGEAISLLFAKEGADIAGLDIDKSGLEKTIAAVKKLGRRAIALNADVADAVAVEAAVNRTIKELGGIHILINGAGFASGGTVIDETLNNWDHNMNVMLRGTYLCCKYAGPWMTAHKTGKVVNISSTAGLKGAPGMGAYVTAKAGVIALTRIIAAEWAQFGINVNCIAPGLINTPMTQRSIGPRFADPAALKAHVPLGRMGTADDIAKTAMFLVSEDSSFITGCTIPVDGGAFNAGGRH